MSNPFEQNGNGVPQEEQLQIVLKDSPAPFDITIKNVKQPVLIRNEQTGEPEQSMGSFVQVWVSGPFGIYTFYMPADMAMQVAEKIAGEARIAKSGLEVIGNVVPLLGNKDNGDAH